MSPICTFCPRSIHAVVAVSMFWISAISLGQAPSADEPKILPRLSKAQWIWDKAHTGSTGNFTCFFRKSFRLEGESISAAALITVDNNYEFYVNGTLVGSDANPAGTGWNEVERFEIGHLLHKGENVLAVKGVNWGALGGLTLAVRIRHDGPGSDLEIWSDNSWRMTTRPADRFADPEFDDHDWRPVDVLGAMGMAPWGRLVNDDSGELLPRAVRLGLEEPETRTLTAVEADERLEDEWIYQAEGKPFDQRAKDEIGWAREMAARWQALGSPPELADQLARLAALEAKLATLPADSPDALTLYLDVRRVKRQIMFAHPAIDFSKLVFIDVPERYPHESMHRVYPQAQLNCVRLLVLDGLHPGGEVRKLGEPLGPGWHWRPDVSFDGQRVLFCFRPASEKTFHLYEVGVDGTGLRQLTDADYDDMDPIYLPDGGIAFMTTRGNSYARCVVGHPSTLLARCDADGKNIYILSGGGEPEYTPALMPDGRILYTRWEYTDKDLFHIQSLWTVNPDGTGTSVFWGNQSYWPDLLMEARPIPGTSRVLFGAHGHHEVYWGGIGMLDIAKGFNYPHGLTKVTQELPWIEVGDGPAERMETDDYHRSGVYGGYKSPYPLGEDLFLVSIRRGMPEQVYQTRTNASRFKLFLMDIYGNRELIYDGAYHILYGMPVRPRAVPPVLPDRVAWPGAQYAWNPVLSGVLYSADIFQNVPLADQLRQKGRYLRVLSLDNTTFTLGKKIQDADHPNDHPHMHAGPPMSLTVNDGIKRVLGTVPIGPDGSVSFEAPANIALHFQILDDQHRALHTMRSFTNLMPGEVRGCVGCHEQHSRTPATGLALSSAAAQPPARITPYPWGPEKSLAYQRDIQPLLDQYCGACHQGDGEAREKLDLTLRPGSFGIFREPYVTLTLGEGAARHGDFPARRETHGIAGTLIAQQAPWRPEDYTTVPPLSTLSYRSRLVEIAGSGQHHDVRMEPLDLLKLIVWIDTLAPYRGEREVREMADPDPTHPLFRNSNYPPSDITIECVYGQSPYRPRMRTAPLVNRSYRQDEFPTMESRLPRNDQGEILPPVEFTLDGHRIERPWPPKTTPASEAQ